MSKELLLSDIPEEKIFEACQVTWHYTIGFVRLGIVNNQETADLLGSGVLVTANKQYAILTAHHVLEILPKTGRLGLVLLDKEEKTTIDIDGIDYVKIDRGNTDKDGPDIGFVKLSTNIASVIGAKKSFYNLDKRQELFINNPPNDRDGIWDAQGFIEQLTKVEMDNNRKKMVKAFCQYGAFGGIEGYEIRGKYDYYDFPINDLRRDIDPDNFGGISGGGLWQLILGMNNEGELNVKELLLRGIVYFQDPFDVHQKSKLRCHAYKSIYEQAYRVISNNTP